MHPQVPVLPERMVQGAEIVCEDGKEGHFRGWILERQYGGQKAESYQYNLFNFLHSLCPPFYNSR